MNLLFFMPKYRYDPLAVYPTPPSFTPEELERRTAEMWSERLECAIAKIAKTESWNERTGGIQGISLDCLELAALNKHLSSRKLDFVAAIKIAEGVMGKYREEQPKWWKRMDGTPIINDLPTRMAVAFVEAQLKP